MKKFLKILLIIVGIVFLIFAALICIGLFVDYDDHIENGRYTYVPEDDNKDNAYVEFNLSDYDKKDSELIYYSSVEEAILNSPLNAENEEFSVPEDFLNHVDEILHIWNGKQYDTIFYRVGSDNDPVQGFRIRLATYSCNGYEFVSYCRKLPDIQKSTGMPAYSREF